MGLHPYPFHAHEFARERQAFLLAEAEHDRIGRLAAPSASGRFARLSPAMRHQRRLEWQASYGRLVALIAKHGFDVGLDEDVRGWVREQQRLHRLGVLGRRRARLLAVLPGWTWEPAEGADSHAVGDAVELRFAAWATDLMRHLETADFRHQGLARPLSL
jgi:hypothetical protein